jgi:putative acetyltransferase
LAEHYGPDALEIVPESLTSEVAGTLIADLNTRTLGLVRLVLETGTRQAEALALYRRAGFTEISPYGEYAASSATSVCLSKAL